MILILTGKSCAGKDTFQKECIKAGMLPLLSDTTRPMREGEVDGREYNFVKDFNKDNYIEYREYNGTYYGTPKKDLDDSKLYVAIKDCKGAELLKDYYGNNNVYIAYLDVPYDIRRRRSFIRDYKEDTDAWAKEWGVRALRDDAEFDTIWYNNTDIVLDLPSLEEGEETVKKVKDFLTKIIEKREKEQQEQER